MPTDHSTNTDPASPLDVHRMLAVEAQLLQGKALSSADPRELNRQRNALNICALCLSGGGIRSASFALGVLQVLAARSRSDCKKVSTSADDALLTDVAYLSTVSGGGYIGSWLTAWIAREQSFAAVWPKLIARQRGDEDEAPEIAWLRQNSNFLTPKLGITSADTWTASAMIVRNLILNWIVILPVICAILLALKLYLVFVAWLADPDNSQSSWFIVFGLASPFLLAFALRFTTRNRPTRATDNQHTPAFWGLCLFPTLLAAAFLSAAIGSSAASSLWSGYHLYQLALACGCLGAAIYAVSWIAAWPKKLSLRDFLIWSASGLVVGALIGLGLRALDYVGTADCLVEAQLKSPAMLLLVVFGVPWILTSQMIAEMIFVGLTSYQKDSDADREWLARAAGWHLVTAISWALVMGLTFLGPFLLTSPCVRGPVLAQGWGWMSTALTTLGGVSGLATALLGMSSRTPANAEQKPGFRLTANVILSIAAPIFAATLVLALAWGLDQLLLGHALHESALLREAAPEDGSTGEWDLIMLFAGLVGILIVGRIASRSVNINRFSLHALYRNRLVRTFLGASNPSRRTGATAVGKRNWFTGFDIDDNIPMHELWPPSANSWRPFHVVNAALNVVASNNLAWQERKAAPFTFTPLHSGSSLKGYRDTSTYGRKEGMTLGTAMAISGAAASPNMGYHSSPPVMLLMSLCNVRLGWWLGNPGREGDKSHRHEGPHTAIRPLLQETFGLTTDDKEYVYLSDGGHFENLGLYEMVRRRCRFIIVSDAGCDPEHAFEDLSNAVRKIEIDLGVTIDFQGLEELKPRDASRLGKVAPYHAVGVINYPVTDRGGKEGYILYIKAGYHGTENTGVRGYAVANRAFPHEPTSDQWFSESQFESYRSLGYEIMTQIYECACKRLPAGEKPRLANLIEALKTPSN